MKTTIDFLLISRSVLLRMRNVLDKSLHTFYVQLFFSENHAIYEMQKNMVQPDDNTSHALCMLDN